jgi:hypothetical protein
MGNKASEIDEMLAVFLDEGEQVIGQFAKAAAGDGLSSDLDKDFQEYDESTKKADADDKDDDGEAEADPKDDEDETEGDGQPEGDPQDEDTKDEDDDAKGGTATVMAKGVAVQDATLVLERLDKRFAYIAQKLEAQDKELTELRQFAKAQSGQLAVFAKAQNGGMQVMAKAIGGLMERPMKPITGRFTVPNLEDDPTTTNTAQVFAKAVNVVNEPYRVRQLEASYNADRENTAALLALLTTEERTEVLK